MRQRLDVPGSAGRTTVIVVACVVGLILSVVGATGVLALTGALVSSRSSVEADATTKAPTPSPANPSPTAASVSPTIPATTQPTPAPPAAAATPSVVATEAPTAAARPGEAAAALFAVVGVTDGDTIRVRVGGVTERVRLIGLDAPELKGNECWSQKSASKMQSLVQSRSVQLVPDTTQANRDRYGRLLRHVVTEDGRLVAQVLIEGGFAKEYTYAAAYEHRANYLAAQKRAKASKLGVWSAACAAPALVAPRPATTAAPVKPSTGCVIKGNISSSGEKIYHVPGGGSYDVTVITPSKGERWFCTEQEAVNAGWRKARN